MNKIIRTKNDDYTVMSNVFLRDKNLSIKAKGFLAVVMGLPDNWDFSINGMCAVLKEGKSAIYSVIHELKDNKYCLLQVCRNDKGVIVGNDYSFFDKPYTDYPHTENPHMDNPHMDNQPQLNTYINKLSNESIKDKIDNTEAWKNDFQVYLKLVQEAKSRLASDTGTRAYMEKYYANIDYDKSLDKICEGYWATETGWMHKKKSKVKSINMYATLKKSLDNRMNIVYKSKNDSLSSLAKQHPASDYNSKEITYEQF